MEIAELFTASERASLYRYFSTRFKWPIVTALPCLLAGLASVAKWEWDISGLVISCLLALTLVIPFRLADDLADRQRDQLKYPNRELCKAKSLRSYLIVLVFSLFFATVLIVQLRGVVATTILLITTCWIAFWYKVREPLQSSAILNYHIVLTKYIAFVWILIASDANALHVTVHGWWSALTAYVVLLLWEVIHDDTHRNSATARGLAVIEFVLWLAWSVEHLSQMFMA
jgi:hypothetical protein